MGNSYQFIKLAAEEDIVRLTLNRPPLNWLNIEMMEEINHALDSLMGESHLKLLVIQAEGKAFSVGVDVEDHMGDKAEKMISVFHRIFRLLDALEIPSLAMVNGSALGGGCEVATYCDMVLASEKSKFGQPEIQVGVFPPIAALAFPRIVGPKKAFELILAGENISAREALDIGLINSVFPTEQFNEEAESFIAKIRANSSVVLRKAKKAIIQGWDTGIEAGLNRIEEIYMKELMTTEDANEGLKAFLEKRPAQWKGR
jgi:cyclohexa-1,5-dienecarbonyl-CoA hydratase